MDKNIISLSICILSDMISLMIVVPSLIFYVTENGGSMDQYGIIYASFMFSMFISTPFVGAYSDKNGFRFAFKVTQSITILGGILYFIAPLFPKGRPAVYAILLGRLISGIGAGNATLTLAYVARAYTAEEQEMHINLIQTLEMAGTMFGPAPNYLLQYVDFKIFGFHVDKLNSVGLLIVVLNLIALFSIHFYLDEFTETNAKDDEKDAKEEEKEDSTSYLDILKSLLTHNDLLVYIFIVFVVSSCFQIMDIVLTPAASHALGWQPAEVSVAFAVFAGIMTVGSLIIFKLLDMGVKYGTILTFGLSFGVLGFALMYYMWTADMTIWGLLIPFCVIAASASYMQVPVIALYTDAVNDKNDLTAHQGKMQALFQMSISASQFIAPALAAHFIARTAKEIDESKDRREMTPYGLVPVLVLVLCLFAELSLPKKIAAEETDLDLKSETPTESTSLINSGGDTKSSSVV